MSPCGCRSEHAGLTGRRPLLERGGRGSRCQDPAMPEAIACPRGADAVPAVPGGEDESCDPRRTARRSGGRPARAERDLGLGKHLETAKRGSGAPPRVASAGFATTGRPCASRAIQMPAPTTGPPSSNGAAEDGHGCCRLDDARDAERGRPAADCRPGASPAARTRRRPGSRPRPLARRPHALEHESLDVVPVTILRRRARPASSASRGEPLRVTGGPRRLADRPGRRASARVPASARGARGRRSRQPWW